jgi:hypothetical protein
MGNLIKSASNLRWLRADKSILHADIVLADGRESQIGVTANYDTDEGRELWKRAKAGKFGKIAPYVEPAPEELPLMKWQLEAALLEADIDPEQLLGPRDKALWRASQMLFVTTEPVPAIQKLSGLTAAKFKALWSKAREIN